jgi:hypothetical protein
MGVDDLNEGLWHVLQKEPVSFLDPELRGQAAAIGLQKGSHSNRTLA